MIGKLNAFQDCQLIRPFVSITLARFAGFEYKKQPFVIPNDSVSSTLLYSANENDLSITLSVQGVATRAASLVSESGIISDDWFVMEQRQSKVSGINRNASHPVNAILNYGYAVLESQVRVAAAMHGLDTNVSYLHAMKHGRSSLIFDLMEPLRPKVDRVLIEFMRSTAFTNEDFTLSIQGVSRLNPQLARRITSAKLPDSEVQESVAAFRDFLICPDRPNSG